MPWFTHHGAFAGDLRDAATWILPMPDIPKPEDSDDLKLDCLARMMIGRRDDRIAKRALNDAFKLFGTDRVLRELNERKVKIKEDEKRRMCAIKAEKRREEKRIKEDEKRRMCAIKAEKRREEKRILARSPWAVVVQQPVGHGGFHTGVIGIDEPSLRWVYDCGSWRKKGREALVRRIADYRDRTKGHQIDLLFVSHFDADHVSGLDELLRQQPVDTVFIPYLEPEDATAASMERHWSAELAEAVSDPISWFRGRGAVRVVTVRPGAPSDGFPMPRPDGGVGGELLEGELGPRLIGPDGGVLPWWPAPVSRPATWDAEPGTAVAVVSGQSVWTDWWFLPHVHGLPRDVRSALRAAALRAMQDLAGSSGSAPAPNDLRAFNAALPELLKDRLNRRRLREIFLRQGLKDANAISMSLYLGPRDNKTRRVYQGTGARAGWLLTGDAKLGNKPRREEWRSTFSALSKNETIGTLMLPHHGSSENFHDELLSFAEGARLFVTVDNSDLNTRPHPDVRASLDFFHRSYIPVSETNTMRPELSGPIEFSDDALVRAPQDWV